MNKEDRLYKLFKGSDTAVWAHDEIIKQDKRIAEIEAQLKAVLEDNTKLAQVRQSHNLRQQAKGVDDALDEFMDNDIATKMYVADLVGRVDYLNKQAKELEQE
jgi:hypothetical protein